MKLTLANWKTRGAASVPTPPPAVIAPPAETKPIPVAPVTSKPAGSLVHDWQWPSVAELVDALRNFGASVNCSDTGTGKTYVVCETLRLLNRPFLVVCPKTIIGDAENGWTMVTNQFGLKPLAITNYESLRGGKRKWLSMNGQYSWNLPPGTILVFDEAHRCKARTSLNAKMMIAAKRQGFNVIAMSATLAVNPLEMRAVGYAIGLHKLIDFYHWCEDHGCDKGPMGGMIFNKSEAVLLQIHKQIFPKRGTRIRAADIEGFPETVITADSYDLEGNTAAAKAAYDEMQEELARLDARQALDRASALVVMLRARQKVELLKVPLLVQLARNMEAEGGHVVIGVNFTETLGALCAKLPEYGWVAGGQTTAHRNQVIADMKADRIPGVVVNIRAGGVGVGFHDVRGEFWRGVLVCPTFSAVDLVQFLGRVWRDGSKTISRQSIVFAAKTIEEAACRAVRPKLRGLAALNDGDLEAGVKISW